MSDPPERKRLPCSSEAQADACRRLQGALLRCAEDEQDVVPRAGPAALERSSWLARGDLDQRRKAIEQLVKPLRESLEKVDGQIQRLEKARSQAYCALPEQVHSLAATQTRLRSETANLVRPCAPRRARALGRDSAQARASRWPGMVDHCDFVEQETATVDGRGCAPISSSSCPAARTSWSTLRPAAGVSRGARGPDDATRGLTARRPRPPGPPAHGQAEREGYWGQFHPTPEFVVLFLPGETFSQRGAGAGSRR